MSRKRAPVKKALRPTVTLPNGNKAAACQHVKRDGKQCGKPARKGFKVCGSHGAGYAKREREGKRQNPKTASIIHGERTQPETKALLAAIDPTFAATLGWYRDNPQKLRDLDALLAFAWATLHHIAEKAPQTYVGEYGESPPAIVGTLAMLAQTIERVAKIEWKIQQSGLPTLTVRQAQRLTRGVVELLHDVVPADALDDALTRLERLAAIVVGDRDPGGELPERETDAGPA